jgi:hypothetical protein
MVQRRIHDYRGPRSSENLNGHLVGVMPPGVYQSFHVRSDGSVSPGVLVTAEGTRIEETEDVSVPQPLADPDNPRIDLVVCVHEYEKTVPAPPALFTTVPGTPAPDPQTPDLPEHAILLATCRMEAGAGEWTDIKRSGPPVRVYNAVQQLDQSWKIVHGVLGALLEQYEPNLGYLGVFAVAPGTYQDGATIDWGSPVLLIGAEGIQQVEDVKTMLNQEEAERQAGDSALNTAKLDKAGGTITGDLAVQGKLTLDADDVEDVAFDAPVSFVHWVQPCEAKPGAWENLGFAWKSVDDALGKTLYVPIRGIIGAELMSVDVGLCNIGAVSLNVILGFSTTVLTNFLGGSIDFGEVTVAVNGGESVVTNVPLVDPQPPHAPLPFSFDLDRPIWLRVKTGGAGILFTGARLNYRRMRVVV